MKTHIPVSVVFTLLLLNISLSLCAEQQHYTAGYLDNWNIIHSSNNIRLESGKEGLLDIMLDHARYSADDEATDMLIHFDEYPLFENTGNYAVIDTSDTTLVSTARIGTSAAFFSGESNGISMQPKYHKKTASIHPLFSPGTLWKDFSLEFWLRPRYLESGETILEWNGQRNTPSGVQRQALKCSIQNRRLRWEFNDFFLHPDFDSTSFLLSGTEALVPEVWTHHMVRFNSKAGVLEYLVDGNPEAIIYTTQTAGPDGTVLLPYIGDRSDSKLIIGGRYAGLIDEFRISASDIREPHFQKVPLEGGEVILGPIDLEEMGSQLLSIDLTSTLYPGSSIFYYYRLGENRYDFDIENPEWIAFTPGETFSPVPSGAFLQIRCELFPDGSGMHSPVISNLQVNYRPDLPPPAPVGLTVTPLNAAVELSWNQVNQRDIGGYLVYYGTSSQVYRGTGSGQGSSPIDVKKATSLKLTSLENGRLYYFAVAAYDTLGPTHRSILSGELSARPSAYYGD